jgi:hypothetical protein
MLTLRELISEYILFAFTEEELMAKFQVTEEEIPNLTDIDLLEIYDQTLLTPIVHQED